MILVYAAVAFVAIWCLAKAIAGPAGRLEMVDRYRNEFHASIGPLMASEDLFPEHRILLAYMEDNVSNPDLPMQALSNLLTGDHRRQIDEPPSFCRDLTAAQKTLRMIRPDLAARIERAARAFLQANTGQVPMIGGLCRRLMWQEDRLDMAVPGLVEAYEATLAAPAERISKELSAA